MPSNFISFTYCDENVNIYKYLFDYLGESVVVWSENRYRPIQGVGIN